MTDTTDTTTTPDNSAEIERLTKAVAEANAEAAKYRVEKKDAVEAAKQEVTESFNARIADLEAELSTKDTDTVSARNDADRLRATIKAGIDTEKALDFAELLKGETEDELVSHAETLKTLFASDNPGASKQAPVDPSQGRTGKNVTPLNGDPILQAIERAVNR